MENSRLNNELVMVSSSTPNVNDACATNSISCEASMSKENVELRAQLESLTSKYSKLEESHKKLSSSNDDLLASYSSLKLGHEAITTKVTSSESHVYNSTTVTKNAIMPCASPSSSSTKNVGTSCDELLALPCCSNNDASTLWHPLLTQVVRKAVAPWASPGYLDARYDNAT